MDICAKKSPQGEHMCWRETRHLGLHRNHPRLSKATVVWADTGTAPEQDEEAASGR